MEELVSSGCLKNLLKNRVQQENLRELYEFLTQQKPYFLRKLRKSSKKVTKN
jgi:hypothetical protein